MDLLATIIPLILAAFLAGRIVGFREGVREGMTEGYAKRQLEELEDRIVEDFEYCTPHPADPEAPDDE